MTITTKDAGVVIRKVKKLHITVDMTVAANIGSDSASKKNRGQQCQGQSSSGLGLDE